MSKKACANCGKNPPKDAWPTGWVWLCDQYLRDHYCCCHNCAVVHRDKHGLIVTEWAVILEEHPATREERLRELRRRTGK